MRIDKLVIGWFVFVSIMSVASMAFVVWLMIVLLKYFEVIG